MNYIDRWGLMRNSRRETLAEHSAVTACVAHVLATAARDVYEADVRPETVATAALYHDMSETLTGDMPTPVKYANEDIRTSYKQVEREAEQSVCRMLPPEPRVGDCRTARPPVQARQAVRDRRDRAPARSPDGRVRRS